MIDLDDYIEKLRPDAGTRKFYKHYCDNCGKDNGYKRKNYETRKAKYAGLCHECANDINYCRKEDNKKYCLRLTHANDIKKYYKDKYGCEYGNSVKGVE